MFLTSAFPLLYYWKGLPLQASKVIKIKQSLVELLTAHRHLQPVIRG